MLRIRAAQYIEMIKISQMCISQYAYRSTFAETESFEKINRNVWITFEDVNNAELLVSVF